MVGFPWVAAARISAMMTVLGATTGAFGAVEAPRIARLDTRVLTVAFERVADTYLTVVDPSRIALDAVNGLSSIDPTVKAVRDGAVIRVLIGDRSAGEFVCPPFSSPDLWATTTMRAIEATRRVSKPTAAASPDRIYRAALDSVTRDLDEFSRYSDPKRAADERAERDGDGEIGATVAATRGGVIFKTVRRGSSAARAGLRPGDRVLSIDGASTVKLRAARVESLLRGAVGEDVRIKVARGKIAREIVAVREWTAPETVGVRIADNIATLSVDRFSVGTAARLRDAVVSVRRTRPIIGLILDLRDNPGGLLDQAVATADLFMPSGRIVSTDGRHFDSRQVWDAKPDDVTNGLPMVVLINGRSASSAEVVAAALGETGRAVVVGSTSFGKGSVQTVTRLPNDGELFLTWSRYYTPLGHSLHGRGVLPTVCTANATGVDQALEATRTVPAVPVTDPTAVCPRLDHNSEIDTATAKRLLTDRSLIASLVTRRPEEAALARR